MRDLMTRGNCAIHRQWEAKITTGILVQPSMEASTQQTNNLRMLFQKEIQPILYIQQFVNRNFPRNVIVYFEFRSALRNLIYAFFSSPLLVLKNKVVN